MSPVEISPLRMDEAEALVDLAGRIWRTCYPGIVSMAQIEYMLAERYKPGLVRQLMARGDLWLAARAIPTAPGSAPGAESEGTLIGFAHGHPLEDGDYKLDKLYVDVDWQRYGVGGKLIAEVAGRARSHGFSRLVLRVNRGNQRAIDAYLKHGFTVATIIMEDIGGGFMMDDYVMVKDL